MAQPKTGSAYRWLDLFLASPSQEPPVSWEEWSQCFQLIVIAKEEIDFEDLLQDSALPENPYPVPEEAVGTKDQQARADREAQNATAVTTWRGEKNRREEDERPTFKGATRGEADKRLKSKLFLSLGKQGQRYFNQKHPYRKIVDMALIELWKTSTDTFQKEPNLSSRSLAVSKGKTRAWNSSFGH